MLQVRVRVKRDEVRAKHPIQQLFAFRQYSKHFRGRERNMQEKANRGPGQRLAQHPGEQHQVIVVHPQQVALAILANNRVPEELVGRFVCGPAFGVEGQP
jgi:hypothetical protein